MLQHQMQSTLDDDDDDDDDSKTEFNFQIFMPIITAMMVFIWLFILDYDLGLQDR